MSIILTSVTSSVAYLHLFTLEAFLTMTLVRIAHFQRISIRTSDTFSILIRTSDTPVLILTSDVSH